MNEFAMLHVVRSTIGVLSDSSASSSSVNRDSGLHTGSS